MVSSFHESSTRASERLLGGFGVFFDEAARPLRSRRPPLARLVNPPQPPSYNPKPNPTQGVMPFESTTPRLPDTSGVILI